MAEQNYLTVATWNIAGGRTMLSSTRFDYSDKENAGYFIEQLTAINADIICLQESHSNEVDSLSKRTADGLGMKHLFETVNHPSHIDDRYNIATAIISNVPMTHHRAVALPYPAFELMFPDGRPSALHQKYLQMVDIGGVMIANAHVNNLKLFGYSYHEGKGKDYARELEEALAAHLASPLIFAADLNFTHASSVLRNLFSKLSLTDALPEGAITRPEGSQTDYLLHTPEIKVEACGIVPTTSDHYLCWAKFGY